MALEKSFGDDGDALRLERRQEENKNKNNNNRRSTPLPLRVSRRNGERLYQASFPVVDYHAVILSSSRGYASSQTTKTILRVKTTVSFRTTSSSRITSHRSRNSSTSTTHPTPRRRCFFTFLCSGESKVAAETLVAGCEKSLRDYEKSIKNTSMTSTRATTRRVSTTPTIRTLK